MAQELTNHLLGLALLGPGRAGIGAGVRNCIVIQGGRVDTGRRA